MVSSTSYGGSTSLSRWLGRSSADGGFSIVDLGITGRRELTYCDRRYTRVLGTSEIAASPPTMSPYRVQYPTASSDLLPVLSTNAQNLLESAISTAPRMRDCKFSSVTSSSRPAKTCFKLWR